MEHLAKTRAKIKLLKYIFLSTGCCVLIAIIITLYLNNTFISQDVEKNSAKNNKPNLSKKYNLTINRSIFEGLSSNLIPYKISANTVSKDLTNKYILSIITGKYSLNNGNLTIKATNGILDEDNKFIILKDNVIITLNNIIFISEEIKLNLKNQEAHSDTNVEVNFNNSSIKADSFNTKDSNNIIEFKGNVKSNFNIKRTK